MIFTRNKKVIITLIVIVGIGILASIYIYIGGAKNISSYLGYKHPDAVTVLVGQDGSAEFVADVVKQYALDKKYNLDVTYKFVQPGELERQYFSSNIPIAYIGVQTAAAGYQQNVPTVILGPALLMTYSIAVPTNSSIHSLADLKGKVLGILPKATAAYSAVVTVLESAGVNPQKDLTFSFGSVPTLDQQLVNGEVDASIVSYPLAASLVATGKVRIIANLETVWEQHENGLPLPFVIIGVRSDWYNTHADIAKRYLAMWLQATHMLTANPQLVDQFTTYLKASNLDSPAALANLNENIGSTLDPAWTQREIDGAIRFFDRFQQYGFISTSVKPPVFVH